MGEDLRGNYSPQILDKVGKISKTNGSVGHFRPESENFGHFL